MEKEDADALIVETLRQEIEERKQYLEKVQADREQWGRCIRLEQGLKGEMNREKPGSESREEKQKELKECHEKLEQIKKDCYEKYMVNSAIKLHGYAFDYESHTKKLEERLQKLEGMQKQRLSDEGSQSHQEEGGQIQQRTKVVAEHQADFMRELEKYYEPVRPPDDRGQSKYTVSRQMIFQEAREVFKSLSESKEKERGRDRGGREK